MKHRLVGSIGCISPYKSQVHLLKRELLAALSPDMFDLVEVNTVDGFQGRLAGHQNEVKLVI